jgi:hypothetical protein
MQSEADAETQWRFGLTLNYHLSFALFSKESRSHLSVHPKGGCYKEVQGQHPLARSGWQAMAGLERRTRASGLSLWHLCGHALCLASDNQPAWCRLEKLLVPWMVPKMHRERKVATSSLSESRLDRSWLPRTKVEGYLSSSRPMHATSIHRMGQEDFSNG